MEETLLLVSKAVFAAVGCVAGLRLAVLARRPTGRPAHAWASATIFVGGLGLVGFGLGPSLAGESRELARAVMLAADALERLALLSLAVFFWRVFGAGSGARMIALGVVLVAMTAIWTRVLLVQCWPDPVLPPQLAVASPLAFGAPYAWGALDAWLAARSSSRAREPGVDPVLESHRFRLYALGCGLFAAICLATAARALLPPASGLLPPLALLRAFLYTAVAGIAVLALFPPARYERWVRSLVPAH
jgi:hypothetical protein